MVNIARVDTRYSFTAQFFEGAALQARSAFEIEAKPVEAMARMDKIAHRANVVGAIMQSVAALESEIWEIIHHGPGHQLGTNGVDLAARDFLLPVAEAIERQSVLDRYAMVLHLLSREPLDQGLEPWQDAHLIVGTRNPIVHYKSVWSTDQDRQKLLTALRNKHRAPPSFERPNVAFFPHRCLGADFAAWSVETCVAFMDAFYVRLGAPNPLDSQREPWRPDRKATSPSASLAAQVSLTCWSRQKTLRAGRF